MKKTLPYRLNLQMFAEEPENKEPENKEPENKEPENKEPENKEPENKEPENKAASQAGLVEPENKPQNQTSSKRFASAEEVEALTRLVEIHGETTKASHEVITHLREELRQTQEELRETTELLQNLIGQMDEHSERIVTSAAAMVKLHQEQSKKKAD